METISAESWLFQLDSGPVDSAARLPYGQDIKPMKGSRDCGTFNLRFVEWEEWRRHLFFVIRGLEKPTRERLIDNRSSFRATFPLKARLSHHDPLCAKVLSALFKFSRLPSLSGNVWMGLQDIRSLYAYSQTHESRSHYLLYTRKKGCKWPMPIYLRVSEGSPVESR